jgi:hypothetical protein
VSSMHLKRKVAKAPLVVTEVRRSVRLKGRHRVIRRIPAPAKFACVVMLTHLP